MNIKASLKLISPIPFIVGIAMILTSIISVIYHESPYPLLIGGLCGIICGLILIFVGKKSPLNNLTVKEGCFIATFSWLIACLLGAIPFFLLKYFSSDTQFTLTKSIFEAVSGFTTTGASILSNIEIMPKGILFWRSLTHWFGGMGIVVFAIAILPKLGIGGLQAFRMESPGPLKTDKLVPRISQTGKILYTVYLAITIVEIILLLLVGVNFYDALVHTFGTVGTGGFSNYNNSVSGLNNIYAEYIIAFFMWLSGVNFGLTFLVIWKRKISTFWKDAEFKIYTSITLIAILTIIFGLYVTNFNNLSLPEIIRYSVFQVPTIMTTTGYATFDFNLWPAFPLVVLVLLMFVGGSTGSTGGGLKVLRHLINFKFTKHELSKIVRPNLVSTVKIGDGAIDTNIVASVLALTIIYLLVFISGGFLLTLFHIDLITAFSASIANLGNIGPGLKAVGPAANYSFMPNGALWILMAEMILGRLEIYTVLALFVPSIWRKK